ncbi:MAG: PfkB family carbohydrate kinase [Candidatus Scalindua sp.]|nr:PfkB family carbohydrate kinase [Candidatus Scalindua sp.]
MRYEVVGLGQCSVDYLGRVEKYPGINMKREVADLTIQGGGPVATALVTLSRLGVSTSFIGKISDDYFGKLIQDGLREEGVNIDHLVVENGKKSQFAFIPIEKKSGERTIFWSKATVSPFSPEEVNKDLIRCARVLHLDELMIEGSLEAARCARDAGVLVAVDAGSFREGSLEVAGLADYYITSEDFVCQFYHRDAAEEAARELLKLGPKAVIVTLGDKGSLTVTNREFFYLPAFQVKAVDTTGCGDVFHGAFIYGLLKNWELRRAVRFASAAAALKCRKIGGRTAIPNLQEVNGFLKNDGQVR